MNISCSNLHCKDSEIRILIRFQGSSRPINSIHDLCYGTAYRWAKSGVWWQVLRHSKPYKSELPFCFRYKRESNVNKCHIFCVLLQSYKTLPWLQNSFYLPLGNVNMIWQPHHIKHKFVGKKTVMMFIALKKPQTNTHCQTEKLNIAVGLSHIILFLISTKKLFT